MGCKNALILGIETSCDETSAAVVEDGKKILSNAVYSQVNIHKKFDGVVPEVASRNHFIKIIDVMEEALHSAGLALKDMDAVAVTNGPGLVGSLLIGMSTAKAVSYALRKILIAVNHIEAHMYAPHLFHEIEFPYIGLVVSGGHTILYLVKSFTDMELLGSTIDDAAGEAFDKVAKLLGLGYPGGPVIDETAKNGNPERIEAFRNMPVILPGREEDRYKFSYSGLKTAVAYRLRNMEVNRDNLPDICAAFQKAAVGLLVRKARNALSDFAIKRLVISGGVAANAFLRSEFQKMKEEGLEIFTAPAAYCGDNAAMVAGRGYRDFLSGKTAGMDAEVYSRQPLVVKGKKAV